MPNPWEATEASFTIAIVLLPLLIAVNVGCAQKYYAVMSRPTFIAVC